MVWSAPPESRNSNEQKQNSINRQRFSKHVFVTRNNLLGYVHATNNFNGYALDYKSGHADKNDSIRQAVVVQGSCNRKENQELIKIFSSQ
jgi:hypothetical protein